MEVTTTVLSRCRVKSSPKSACRPATQTHCPVAKYCQHRARPPCFSAFQWLSWFLLTQLPLPTLAHFYSFLIVPSSHTGQNTTAIHNYTNKAIRKGKGRQVSWLPPRFGGKGEWLMHVICFPKTATTILPVLRDSAEPCQFPQRYGVYFPSPWT